MVVEELRRLGASGTPLVHLDSEGSAIQLRFRLSAADAHDAAECALHTVEALVTSTLETNTECPITIETINGKEPNRLN